MLLDHRIPLSLLTNMKRQILIIALLATCSIAVFAQGAKDKYFKTRAAADSAYHHWEEEPVWMEQVVVTGTRTPKSLKDVPIQTRLITAQDIQKVDATNVEDLLQQEMPGVEFSYAMNQQTHLNFSGFGGQNVLFLVDGERLAGETMDDVDFTRLNMASVERIEIVKGAASALYGSSAAGGVINIITKEPTKPWSLNVNTRVSKHNEWRYGASLGLNGYRLQNMLSYNATTIDNYNFTNGPKPLARTVVNFFGDNTFNVKDQLIWRPVQNFRLTTKVGYFFREQVRTESVPEHYRDFMVGLRGNWDITKQDNLEVSYHFDQYDKSDFRKLDDLEVRDYSNVQNSLRTLYNHSFERGDVLTVGTDYMHDYLMNLNFAGGTREEDSFDFFAQYDWEASDKLEVVSALRYDYFSDGDQHRLTPKLSARYQPISSLNLRASYGMGFRAPKLKEKYYNFDMAGIWIIQGYEGLKSELSHNFNASVEYSKRHYNITLGGYYNDVENRIATGSPYVDATIDPTRPDQLYLSYINLKNYSTFGFDMTAQVKWENGVGVKLSYAFVHEELPHDDQGESINNQYIPARSHSLTARCEWDRQFTARYGLNVSFSGRAMSGVDNDEYVDYRTKDANGHLLKRTIHYNPYSIWKLSLAQRIGPAIRFTIAAENVFNYKPDYYYLNAPLTDGISLQVGMSIDVEKLFEK